MTGEQARRMDDSNDLFARLDKTPATPARASSRPADPIVQAVKRSRHRQGRQRRLRRQPHRGARRAGAGAPPARHVYRRHRREGAAPSVRRSHRQFDGRGGGRPCHLHRCRADRRRVPHRHRQWPRHPGRPASEVQEQVGARSHHDDAAFGRQIRLQGLRDLGRPARRRRFGRQRAVGSPRGRGGARPPALPPALLARRPAERSWSRSARSTTGAAPRSASIPTRRSSARTQPSSRRASTAWRAPRPICSAASKSAGAAIRCSSRRRTRRRPRRRSISPAG